MKPIDKGSPSVFEQNAKYMQKLKPLIYAFFFFYFVTYCTVNKLTKKESSYDYEHNKIYTPNYNKNKYVGLQKGSIS